MNEDGTPIVEAPADTPPADNPGGDNPAGDTPPADAPAATHIQPGQAPTDLDMDALLAENEAEEKAAADAEAAKKAEDDAEALKQENLAKGLNEDGTPKAPAEDPNKPPVEDPNKPQLPADVNQPVDLNDIDQYFNAVEDPRYNIKPIGEIRDPEAGESAADYYKNVTLPAMLQTQANRDGFAQRNADIESGKAQEAMNAKLDTWVGEMKTLSEQGLLPKFDDSKPIDPKSDAGKVIGDTWNMINEYNKEHPQNRIESFDHGFRSLYQPKAAADKAQADAAAADARRAAGNTVITGRGGNNATPPANGPRAYRKGQSVTDIDFEKALG